VFVMRVYVCSPCRLQGPYVFMSIVCVCVCMCVCADGGAHDGGQMLLDELDKAQDLYTNLRRLYGETRSDVTEVC